ncbi:MAG: ABC-2 family transporter protein [Leptospiraceae bacterium]|nr:ABC-2 family transporter protein [Leptospiraceae bacterium]
MRAIKNTLRYIRLYYYFVRFSFMRAMEFRVDFTFRIFMDVIYYAVNIALYKIIFLHTEQLGGWSENEALIFVAGYLLADSIYMTVFANNLWWLPYFINRGDLDYYLVRPVSSLFFLSLRDFAANSTINILAAVGIFAWATLTYQNHFYWYQLIVYIVLIFNGAFFIFFNQSGFPDSGILDSRWTWIAVPGMESATVHGTPGPDLLRLGASHIGKRATLRIDRLCSGPFFSGSTRLDIDCTHQRSEHRSVSTGVLVLAPGAAGLFFRLFLSGGFKPVRCVDAGVACEAFDIPVMIFKSNRL